MQAHTPRLLIVDDDRRLADMLGTYLMQNGMEVEIAGTAATGIRQLRSVANTQPFSAVVLDLMLPDTDGLEVCRIIRAMAPPLGSTPIVMLTAKGDAMDRVVGLELGADDYLPKPFEPRELLARLRAVLRRPHFPVPHPVLCFGGLEINCEARYVRVDGRAVVLTSRQFDLLVVMAERAGRVLSREQLMDAVSGDTTDATDRSIDVHIGRLRAAIEDDPKQPRRIVTVRGTGYCFARLPGTDPAHD